MLTKGESSWSYTTYPLVHMACVVTDPHPPYVSRWGFPPLVTPAKGVGS
jgi:hypothetical protein